MIIINHVSKSFGADLKAVDDISLKLDNGEIIGFIGPNGAGKTTTIKMMTGILEIDSGYIELNGIDISKNPIEAKKQIGFVSDDADIFVRLKGIEYLNFMADIYNVSSEERKERILYYAKEFEMEKALNDKIISYSHGMRQKIVIMGVLICNPKIWILDEPLTGLDPKSSYKLKHMMKEHASKGNTVFFSTHVLEVAEKLCDKVSIINKGKIIYYGTLEQLKSQYKDEDNLEDIFLRVIENEELFNTY